VSWLMMSSRGRPGVIESSLTIGLGRVTGWRTAPSSVAGDASRRRFPPCAPGPRDVRPQARGRACGPKDGTRPVSAACCDAVLLSPPLVPRGTEGPRPRWGKRGQDATIASKVRGGKGFARLIERPGPLRDVQDEGLVADRRVELEVGGLGLARDGVADALHEPR